MYSKCLGSCTVSDSKFRKKDNFKSEQDYLLGGKMLGSLGDRKDEVKP